MKISVLLFAIAVSFGLVFAPEVLAVVPGSVSVSVAKVKQSDTFLVRVQDESGQVTGKFGAQKLSFFRLENSTDWVAIVGVSVSKQPGTYWLVVNVPDQPRFKKVITVAAKKFPVTKLQFTQAQLQQGYTAKKLLQTIVADSNVSLARAMAVATPTAYFSKPFGYPLETIAITGNYGDIRKNGAYKVQHLGVDLRAAVGTSVQAVNNGKVVLAENLADYGNTLVIDHGLGIYSLYLHLSSFKVAVGDMVTLGQVVALSGDTGYVLGPHLHFSIKIKGVSVDPLSFIAATQDIAGAKTESNP